MSAQPDDLNPQPAGESPRAELPPELRRALVSLIVGALIAGALAIGGVFYALDRSGAQTRAAIAHANELNRAAIRANDRKFCAVVQAATRTPVHKPPDPAATPGRESTYEFYVEFLALGRSLGCD